MGSGGKTRWKLPTFSKHRHQNQNHHHHRQEPNKQQQQQQQQPPKDFLCPISGHLMADPVILPTGQTFERCCIQACVDLGLDPPVPSLDPSPPPPSTTTAPLVLVPNLALRSTILTWCDSHGVDRPQPISPQSALSLVYSLTSSSSPSTPLNGVHHHQGEGEEEAEEASAIGGEKEDVFESSSVPELHRHTKSTPTTLHYSSSTSSSSFSWSSSDEFGSNKKAPCSPLEEQILSKLKSSEVSEQEKGLLLLRARTRESKEERVLLCTQNVLSALRPFLSSRLPTLQSNAVAALLNLTLYSSNKVPVIRSGAVPPLVSALKSLNPEIRSHASAAIFSLAVEESSKAAIGALGALPPLLSIITKPNEQEDVATRRDAALALYHLSTSCSTNRSKLARLGAARILLSIIASEQEWGKLGGVMLMLVGNLAGCMEGRAALLDAGAIEVIVGMIRRISSSAQNYDGSSSNHEEAAMRKRIEQCVGVLYGLSKGGLRFHGLAKSAGAEEILMDLVAEEDGFNGDEKKGGGGASARQMAERMLRAMSGEASVGSGSFGEIDDLGIDDDTRSTVSDPAVASPRHSRGSHLGQISGVNSSEF